MGRQLSRLGDLFCILKMLLMNRQCPERACAPVTTELPGDVTLRHERKASDGGGLVRGQIDDDPDDPPANQIGDVPPECHIPIVKQHLSRQRQNHGLARMPLDNAQF